MLSPLQHSLGPLGTKRGRAAIVLTETANLLTWLEADAGTFQSPSGSAATADNDPVGEWRDQSGNNKHATQMDSNLKPKLRLGANGLNNLPAIEFDGTNDGLSIALSSTSGTYSFYVVMRSDTATGLAYFYDTQTGRLIFVNHAANGTSVAWFDGSFHNIAVATTPPQVVSYHVGSSTGEIYRGSTLLGSDTYTSKNLGDAQRIGSAFDGGGAFFDGAISLILFYSVKHNSTQRGNVLSYISAKYGV